MSCYWATPYTGFLLPFFHFLFILAFFLQSFTGSLFLSCGFYFLLCFPFPPPSITSSPHSFPTPLLPLCPFQPTRRSLLPPALLSLLCNPPLLGLPRAPHLLPVFPRHRSGGAVAVSKKIPATSSCQGGSYLAVEWLIPRLVYLVGCKTQMWTIFFLQGLSEALYFP